MSHSSRKFEIKPATRTKVPLLIGLVGPSSSGKTVSALRLATGMARVYGGRIGVIDTEADRARHYAPLPGQAACPPKTFDFDHMSFAPPFSPLDYLDAIRSMASSGVKTIVVDSTSHEHEGPGGVLEWHEKLTEELAQRWKTTLEKAQLSAWGAPKAARRKLLNEIVQMGINTVFCFRAKEKIKIIPGKDPVQLGWMPIAGEEFVFEMTANFLLPPRSDGRPMLMPREEGEKMIAKMPGYFVDMVSQGRQIDEKMGEDMARWAAGEAQQATQAPQPQSAPPKPWQPLLDALDAAGIKDRGQWISTQVGRSVKSANGLTQDEIQRLTAFAIELRAGAPE